MKEYLLSLTPDTRIKVMAAMVERKLDMENTLDGGCVGKQPTGPGSTPNGDWQCVDGQWTWIPDIG